MRNQTIQTLPPGASIQLSINPAIGDGEKPYVFTIRGQQSIVVRVIDTTRIEITNPTNEHSPFLFFVTKTPWQRLSESIPPSWLQFLV